MPACRIVVIAVVAAVAGCAGQTSAPATQGDTGAIALPSTNVVDLSYPFNAGTVYWPTAEGFHREVTASGITERGYYYASGTFTSAEHGGTHIDAPIHFAEGGQSVDEIPLEQLMGPAVVVDVTQHAESNADYQISAEDLQAWESEHRPIPDGSIVLIRTGFGAFWPDRERYMGTSERGAEAVAELHFPGLHPDAARWLVENRNVGAVGIDTPSIDYGQSQLFESHQILFRENIAALENVANLEQLPLEGSVVVALPMKIEDGSGGPVRIVAFVP